MNLVEKELCHHHYNKLIVNKNYQLIKTAKQQQYAYSKHNEYIKNNK